MQGGGERFSDRRNIQCKGPEDGGFQGLKEGPLGWVTEYMAESGAGNSECLGVGGREC